MIKKTFFKSRKDPLFSVSIIGIACLLIGMDVYSFILYQDWSLVQALSLSISLVVAGLILWVYFQTNYSLSKEDGMTYKCGPLSGKIELNRIREIVKGKTLWVGFKPATSRKGLIVKYDKYEEIYISPESNESFIQKILELDSTIKIELKLDADF